MKLGNIAIRNLKRNSKRSLLSISATAIATYSIVFMFSFINGLANDMKDIAFNYTTGEILVRNREFDEKSFSLDRAVDNYKEVITLLNSNFPLLELSPRLKFPASVFDPKDPDRIYSSFGVAVDFESEINFLKLNDKS